MADNKLRKLGISGHVMGIIIFILISITLFLLWFEQKLLNIEEYEVPGTMEGDSIIVASSLSIFIIIFYISFVIVRYGYKDKHKSELILKYILIISLLLLIASLVFYGLEYIKNNKDNTTSIIIISCIIGFILLFCLTLIIILFMTNTNKKIDDIEEKIRKTKEEIRKFNNDPKNIDAYMNYFINYVNNNICNRKEIQNKRPKPGDEDLNDYITKLPPETIKILRDKLKEPKYISLIKNKDCLSFLKSRIGYSIYE